MKALGVTIAIILAMFTSFGSASAATSVTLTMLYQFSGADGSNPEGGLTLGSDGNFYGVTATGGSGGDGTIFKITPEGTLTTLYGFGEFDGAHPFAAPVQGSDGNFYGTTAGGGVTNDGTVYQITTAGTLTMLYSFSGPDGANPRGVLAQGSGSNFYGTTEFGGTSANCEFGCGTVFTITSAGTLTTLLDFDVDNGGAADSGLVLGNDGNFYGTTYSGGNPKTMYYRTACDGLDECVQNPPGTVYNITPSGSLTMLHKFIGPDGANPGIGVIQGVDGAFYGVALFGGKSDKGAVYRITSSGTYTLLYSFTGVDDGAFPNGLLVQGTDGNFYGTTINGGGNLDCLEGCGTAFRTTADGTLTTLYTFTGDPAPSLPVAGLVQVGDISFYGTSYTGGTNNVGTVFQLTVCDFSIDPTNAAFAAAGGSGNISMTTTNGCAWTAVSEDDFITIISGGSGSGNGTISYSVTTNASSFGRIGTMIIYGEPFPVIQSGTSGGGCVYTLSATNATLPARGGTGHVRVTFKGPGCAWTALSNDPFITITAGSSGTGNGTVEYTVPGNTNLTALTGTLTIAGQTFTVNQDAGGCAYFLSPGIANVRATGGSTSVRVIPNLNDCDWTAVSNDSFITITGGASGVGRGTVTCALPANTSANILTGTVTIAGETFTVTQRGEP
jgi:uncharacterized repeat protein (TIGR03803 family)